MKKLRGYVIVRFEDGCTSMVYAEDPKRDFIEPGDEVLTRSPRGEIYPGIALSPLVTGYSDERTDRQLDAVSRALFGFPFDERRVSRLIGMVLKDYWYGDEEEQEDEDAE